MNRRYALAASGLAAIAAVVAGLDRHADYVPFWVGLAFAAACATAASGRAPAAGRRRSVVWAATAVWVLAATWIGVILVMMATVWEAASPPPTTEAVILGVPATGWYLVALYGGTLLMLLASGVLAVRDRDGHPVSSMPR